MNDFEKNYVPFRKEVWEDSGAIFRHVSAYFFIFVFFSILKSRHEKISQYFPYKLKYWMLFSIK